MDHQNPGSQTPAETPPPEILPGPTAGGSRPSSQSGEDLFDPNAWVDWVESFHSSSKVNAWVDSAFPNSSDFPLLAASQPANSRNSDGNDSPTSNIPSALGSVGPGHSLTDLRGLVPMIELAGLARSFLAANPNSQPGSLNLHPIPIESVQTFVLPNQLNANAKDLTSFRTPGQAAKASSPGRLFVGNGGGLEEIMVDLTVTAKRSHVSSAKGRHGPLSDQARAAMKQLKDVGACWHCRFTRKECDTNDPCAGCPKTRPTPWRTVGCRRGTLRDALSPVVLCPLVDSEASPVSLDSNEVASDAESTLSCAKTAEDCLLASTRQRDNILENMELVDTFTESESGHQTFIAVCRKVFARFHQVCSSDGSTPTTSQKDVAEAVLLRGIVVGILWEFEHKSPFQVALANEPIQQAAILSDLGDLLCSAALYQVDGDTDQLIKRSLLCLHTSLEAVRIQSSCKLTNASHQACSSTSCVIGCLSRLDANLKTYIDLLSKVMFKKNSKNCREWWLSVFYSLCIQSYVRKSVITLVSHLGQEDRDGPTTPKAAANQYLQLAVELFAACNDTGKKYDPLNYNLDSPSEKEAAYIRLHSLKIDQAKLAQIVVHQNLWAKKHINGSFAYLREKFEIDSSSFGPLLSKRRREEGMVDHSSPNPDQLLQQGASQGRQKKVCFQGPLKTGHDNNSAAIGHLVYTDLDHTNALNLLHGEAEAPPPAEDLNPLNDFRNTRQNQLRWDGDLYTPRWLRDFRREGWCGLCKPGRWICMKKAWWNDRVLFHGICAETGKALPEPEVAVSVDTDSQTWDGQCRKCGIWVRFKNNGPRHYSAWHVHAANCYDENYDAVEELVTVERSDKSDDDSEE